MSNIIIDNMYQLIDKATIHISKSAEIDVLGLKLKFLFDTDTSREDGIFDVSTSEDNRHATITLYNFKDILARTTREPFKFAVSETKPLYFTFSVMTTNSIFLLSYNILRQI